MKRILTAEIWIEAEKLDRNADSRKLAVAYVTVDHIGLRKGDLLVPTLLRERSGRARPTPNF